MRLRCDSHVHVVAPDGAGMAAGRMYTPGSAPLEALEDVAGPLGVGRFVVVQPSFYGTDNSVTLAALDALGGHGGGHGRGVAVVDPATVDDATLRDMHARGVRGLRINLYSTLVKVGRVGAPSLDGAFGAVAEVAARMGWHVEVLAALPVLAGAAGLLAASPAPVVIDHYGLHEGFSPQDAEGAAVLDLVARPHVWVKLSAPYRVEADPLAVRPSPAWLGAFLAAAPGRCVWGSDWPHTPPHEQQTGDGVRLAYRALDYADVLHGFRDAVGDPAVADRVMVANPARLYGFEEGAG